MNQFQEVCADCPLRTQVDVLRASEIGSFGSSGASSQLSDGSNRYEIRLANGEVNDSDTSRAIHFDVEQRIKACEGPHAGALRSKCAVGLASAWRWTEQKGICIPSIEIPQDIVPLLTSADYKDAMPYFKEPTLLMGDPRNFSELDLPFDSAYSNYGIRKLTESVSGTSARLQKNKAIMLDRASIRSSDDLKNVWRIRVAQGGPRFTFRSDVILYPDDATLSQRIGQVSLEELFAYMETDKTANVERINRIFAEGLYSFLHSDAQSMAESEKLAAEVVRASEESLQAMHDYLRSDKFATRVAQVGKSFRKRLKS